MNALNVLCAQLMRGLIAIAKFLLLTKKQKNYIAFEKQKQQQQTYAFLTQEISNSPDLVRYKRFLVKFTSELRDATCEWDHTVLSATRQR